jgi:methylmalonyl-CoA/ethylmalonyl-CoA epimerase
MVKQIGHIAVLVKSLDETLRLYEDLFGAKAGKIEAVAEQGVKATMLDVGGSTQLEILEPLPGSNMAKTLEKRGEGLHHVCFEVDNINQELDFLASKGVELIDKKARRGLEGMVAFIHPKSLKGVLVELCEKD